MQIRPFRPGDERTLHAIFRSAIHDVASRDYSPEQVNAWAPAERDWEGWDAGMRKLQPWVVEEAGSLLGYADLQADGLIDHFFVSGACQRRGVGRLLMERIHARAAELRLDHLFSHVSLTAQPFFARFGFDIVERHTVVMRGVELRNALMRKQLHNGA